MALMGEQLLLEGDVSIGDAVGGVDTDTTLKFECVKYRIELSLEVCFPSLRIGCLRGYKNHVLQMQSPFTKCNPMPPFKAPSLSNSQ